MTERERCINALPVYTPEEVLKRRHSDLLLEDGAEVHLLAETNDSLDYFARVRANSVSDLQTLGLVPRGLSEESIRKAVTDDDKTAYQTARDIMSRGAPHECSCESKTAGATNSYNTSFARTYRNIRKSAHPALATLLSDHQQTDFRWDSIHVQSVKGWLDRVSQALSRTPLIVALINDIRIGRQSRLVVDPKCVSVLARGIYIHRTGTLIHRGGYLRIWAGQISRYEDFSSIVRDIRIPWVLTH